MREADFQAKIIKWLRAQGCIVLKQKMDATTRSGTPDLIFLKEGFWGAIEVKKSKTSSVRPGQKENIAKMNEWSWAKFVWPENWSEVQSELKEILK